jgi:hypothetical protein
MAIAYITGTGTVTVGGEANGSTSGFIGAGMRRIISVSVMAGAGSSTASVHDTGDGTGVGLVDTIVAATGSYVRADYGRTIMANGIRVVPAGTLTCVTVVYE